MNFTHLHVHTQYSLLDGSNKIEEYVARVKELGMDSAAITDHGAMYGCIDFYKAAKAAGIKPIMGCEVYVAPKSRFDREAGSQEDRYYHLVLLAENNVGYANLMKIVSKGFVEGFYYKPRVDLELLEKYHQGLIALSACLAGEVPRYLVRGMYQEAKEAALRYQQIFGEGNYFLELQDHGIPEQQTVNQQLMRLHQETGIELTATNDVHYTYAQDATAHDILLCIQTAKKLDDEDRMRYEGGQYYVKSPQEMAELFPYALEALENTHKIAMRCNVEIEFGVTKLPKYDVPQEYTSWEYLNKLCREGLERLYHPVTEELKDRLQYELDTISDMGFVDYFLIVWDFIKYARDHGISVGPGRGSAAGSLVSYTLGITRLDPIKYNLLFERFLNPERVSMPDIDIDFCFERRQEVIDYVVEKYGKDRVVQIVTFGTMAARGVIRDVGRVLDLPYAQVDTVAKMIPTELNITIDKAMERNPELAKTYREDDQIHNLIDMAKRLEGLPRHTSMHAAGVVISQKDIDEYVPLSRATDGSITTQFTMTTLEELGLLKMDFLGLRTLTVIQDTEKLVEKDIGICLDMDKIDYSDEKVLSSIGTGKTEGVFQLESAGMKNFMKELKPRSLEDVIAGIALYRPGPMDFIPQYIRGKNNAETVTYDCPQLKPILEATYGCIVYQEQVMQIVRELGGYTLGRSDLLRRAMSKKKAAVMEKERKSFVYGNEEDGIPGCIKNGIDEKIADKIYDDMIDFAKYAFNKSHAAAYAVVAYQTAYLKYYYPQQFMAALMTSVIDFPSKVSEYILHCRQIGIDILPPDVNSGGSRFSVDGTGIRYGMSAIKSVGKAVIDEIVAEREKNGLFTTLNHFITRMSGHEVNKRVVENLIKAGALDCLEGSRRQKMMIYTQIMDSVQHEKKNSMAGQMSLMDIVGEEEKKEFAISLPQVEDYDKETILSFEKEVLGIYISGHPLERYTKILAQNATAKTVDFLPDDDTGFPNLTDGKKVIIGGMITNKTLKYTRNNKVMAFLTVEDLVGTVEIIVFPRDYEKNVNRLEEDNKVFILGRVAAEDDKASKLICEKMWLFTEVPRELWVQFSSKEEYQEKEEQLAHALDVSRGADSVVVFLKAERAMKRLPSGRNISIDSLDMERFCEKFGRENVKVLEKSIEKAVKMH
ncbi:MAG: DNA polymerase III subunit alpha [Lachnospiraceae bacterium]|nr:DNA polymerase III subunit alpha [Lachnospiraceae bacterium]